MNPTLVPTSAAPLTLYKSVLGTDNPTYEDCVNIPASTPYLKLVMGTVVDYFRPVVGKTYCDMLNSRKAHQWSSDGQNWVTPLFYSLPLLGGSADFWPSDGRTWLSFWGGHGNKGGCCQDSYNGIPDWGKSFELYYPGEEARRNLGVGRLLALEDALFHGDEQEFA